jgi:hypothetical protein
MLPIMKLELPVRTVKIITAEIKLKWKSLTAAEHEMATRPFFAFENESVSKILDEHPNFETKTLRAEVEKMWNSLSIKERKKYIDASLSRNGG